MNASDVAPIIHAITGLVTSLGIAYSIYLSRGNRAILKESVADVKEIKAATNGMKDELVKSTAKASKFEGREEERTEERDRQTIGPGSVTKSG